MKRYWACLCISFSVGVLSAQRLEWKVDALGFADNREYNSSAQIPQSMLGLRLTPLVGLNWDDRHHFFAGANALHEFGSNRGIDDIIPTAYYLYESERFTFRFGAFPRSETLADFPAAFFYDSLTYYRPNVNGLAWQYHRPNLQLGVFLDWISRQTDTRREAFIMGGSGLWRYDMTYWKFNYYMYHRAGRATSPENDRIHDMGLGHYALGIDAGKQTALDTLYVQIGLLQGYERRRSEPGIWYTPKGLLVEAAAEWQGIGLKNTFYMGDKLMVYWDFPYNAERDLYWGDPFYHSKLYNRTDLYINLINTNTVRARFDWSFHYSDTYLSTQQQFIVSLSLDNLSKQKPKKTPYKWVEWFK